MRHSKEVMKSYPFRLGEYELRVIDSVSDEDARRWYKFGSANRSEKLRYIISEYDKRSK